MELTEKTVSSQSIYDGKILRLRRDEVLLPNGHRSLREVVDHPGGVCVLAIDSQGRALLVRQFRYPFGRVITELPAGKLERGEDHRVCALRELEEETGYTPATLTYMGALLSSPGFTDEVLHMYLARGLKPGECHPDEDEFLERDRVPLGELVKEVMDGTIQDAKTVAAVLKAKVLLDL